MIGGTDVVFEVHATRCNPAVILHACLLYWPQSLCQKSDESTAVPVEKAFLNSFDRNIGSDFFVYKNKESYDTWMRDGATPSNEDTMLQFIITDTSTAGWPFFQLTMVSDTRSSDIRALEALLRGFLESTYNLLWSGRHELATRPITGDTFEYSVVETCILFFPKMLPMDILFNPRIALELCDMVRYRLKQPIPDNMILQALLIKSHANRV